MPKKISFAEFQALLENPDTPDGEIAKYLRPAGTKGFEPVFEANPELVEPDQFESGMTIGNWWCRRRRRRRFERRLADGVDFLSLSARATVGFSFRS